MCRSGLEEPPEERGGDGHLGHHGIYRLEGLWVLPSDSSTGPQGLGVERLPVPNGDVGGLGLYDSWAVMGFFHAATTNPNEPVEELLGVYSPFPLWMWSQ